MTNFETLRDGFRGEILTPDSAGYDDARRVWNGAIDRYPAVIARCTGAADVAAALRWAVDSGAVDGAAPPPVAVRGGGHSIPGHSTCDGGIVIDLGPMKGLRVDPAARTATAQPGLVWAEYDRETQAFGLAGPGGEVSDTGIAGLTLGGGIGWLSRMFGLACDNLEAVDVVTADSRVLTASATQHPDLFWGLRGGGGNLGVVTSFSYRLHPVGPLLAGPLLYPAEQAGAVLRDLRDRVGSLPDEVSLALALVTAPPAPFVPEALHGKRVLIVVPCWVGTPADGERGLAALRRVGTPVADLVAPTPYTALQQMVDAMTPRGMQNYVKSEFLHNLDDAAIDALLRCWEQVPSPMSQILLRLMGGAVSRVAPGATAFSNRGATWMLTIASVWPDATADPEPHRGWARDVWQALRGRSAGTYVNHLGDEGDHRIHDAYDPGTYDRLVALKTAYDPGNLFRLNQNIPPRVPATARI